MGREMFGVLRVSPEGFESVTQVARGDDGSFWMETQYLELTRDEVETVRRRDATKVEREPRSGRLFVEVNTLLQCTESADRGIELLRIASEHLEIVADMFPTKWDLM